MARHPVLAHTDHDGSGARAALEARRTAVQRWPEVRSMSRHHLEPLSLSLHPFALLDCTAQTSDQVERRLHAAVDAIET